MAREKIWVNREREGVWIEKIWARRVKRWVNEEREGVWMLKCCAPRGLEEFWSKVIQFVLSNAYKYIHTLVVYTHFG